MASVQSAGAATSSGVYNNIPNPLPGNLPSVGNESRSASEFGGEVELGGTARHNPVILFAMSSFGCVTGHWNTADCSTPPGSTFPEPIRVNVYKVGPGDSPGHLVGAVTHTFDIPYRPSADFTQCTGPDAGRWFDAAAAACRNGKTVMEKVSMGGMDLPDKAIISIEYDTTHYGYEPHGESEPCFSSAGGCGYDFLNQSLSTAAPTKGSQPLPDSAYQYSSRGDLYCDGGAGGTDVFRLDSGCWAPYQPAFRVKATE